MSQPANPEQLASDRLHIWWYALACVFLLGGLATISSHNMLMQGPNRDLWQHAAAIRALIENPITPTNPFVASDETSRHFNPLWVVGAMLARFLGGSEWDVLSVAGYLSAASLGVGILSFAKVYLKAAQAPLVLMIVMLFAWVAPMKHTGLHSAGTLLDSMALPATFLIGWSLLLWALTIRALRDSRASLVIAPLTALMVTTHQLGAFIGLVGAASFFVFGESKSGRLRAYIILAVTVGIATSLLWPYYNPIAIALRPGHSSWEGGPNFYGLFFICAAISPALFGLMGLRGRHAYPLVAALILFGSVYAAGYFGFKIGARFLMPAILVLHIGLAKYLLASNTPFVSGRVPAVTAYVAILVGLVGFQAAILYKYDMGLDGTSNGATFYEATIALTEDLPADRPVAALGESAWPIVAAGHKVLSVPWPEPGIRNLAERQATTASLFDASITAAQRNRRAREQGVASLFLDQRTADSDIVAALMEQSARTTSHGDLMRFDLAKER